MNSFKKFIENIRATIFVIITVGILTLLPNILDPFIPIEKMIENMDIMDVYFSKFKEKNNFDTNIVIVNIGDDRSAISTQIEMINRYNPKVIGIDATFNDKSNMEYDSSLIAAIANSKSIVFASSFLFNDAASESEVLLALQFPDEEILQNQYYGFINFESIGHYETIRNFTPKYKFNDSIYYCFSVEVLKLYDSNATEQLMSRGNDNELINYIGDYRHFIYLDREELLDTNYNKDFLNNKIVLLGFHGNDIFDSLSVYDKYFTPLNPNNISRGLPDMYGVVIHANIISMILNSNYINELPVIGIIILSLIVCFVNVSLFEYIRRRFPQLYGGELKLFIVLELVVCLFLIILIFDIFNFKISILFLFFVIILSQDISEIYFSSFLSIKKKLKKGIKRLFKK